MVDSEKTPATSGIVAYNLGSKQLEIIGELLSKQSKDWLVGDINSSFWALKQIRGMIRSRLNNEEVSKLELLERLYILAKNKSTPFVVNAMYEKYRDSLIVLLEIKGFLVPLRVDKSSLF